MVYAKRYMRTNIATVRDNASVQRICQALVKSKLSGVPVVNSKRQLVGFISERDIIGCIAKLGLKQKAAKDIMQKEVLSVDEDAPLEYVSKLFTEYPYRHLPVVKGARVVGMICRKDVIGKLLSHYY